MKVDTIIKMFSAILAIIILFAVATSAITVGIMSPELSNETVRFLSRLSITAGIVLILCPIIVLAYLIFVFVFHGGVKGTMLKTLILIVGAYLAGGIIDGLVPIVVSGRTLTTTSYIMIFASFVLSLIVWAICAAVNTAVQEKKKSK